MKRDRIVLILGLSGITAISWLYLLDMSSSMTNMSQRAWICCNPDAHSWNSLNLILIFSMWTVMMTAMMVPSESPIVLMFAAINRERNRQRQPFVSTSSFLFGYLVVWTMFSALATLTQWGLHAAMLLSGAMMINNSTLGGTLLVVAGIFQWTTLKYACLTRCRAPLGFLINEWREGTIGAFIMGLRHGIYCVGCCWLLMGLMFIAGVMNLLWMVIITALVLLEKVVPGGFWISRFAGIILVVWGIWMAGGALS